MSADHDRSSGSPAAASGFDVLSDVLRSVQLTGAMLFLVDAHAPFVSWAPGTDAFRRIVLPRAQHLISFHVVTQGRCWAGLRDAPAERFETGDVLVVPHGDAYCLAEPADARAGYGDAEAVAFFRSMAAGELPPTVHEGGDGAATTRFICGFLGCDTKPFNPVLDALPAMVHLRADPGWTGRLGPLVDFALRQLREPASGGQGAVLLRLAELLFVEVLRRHLETAAGAPSGWIAGLHDPLVSRALALLHADPSARWTLDLLAARVGSSRSVLAGRFAHHVGQPPIRYLTDWRMQLASRKLADPGAGKLAAIAEAVGYDSEAAFSRAFKRRTGCSPAAWRQSRAG